MDLLGGCGPPMQVLLVKMYVKTIELGHVGGGMHPPCPPLNLPMIQNCNSLLQLTDNVWDIKSNLVNRLTRVL